MSCDRQCLVTPKSLSKPGLCPLIFTTYLQSDLTNGVEVLCKLWKGKEAKKKWGISWPHDRLRTGARIGKVYWEGARGSKSHIIAPLVDSRGNGLATQSLTQLIIINQAQHLTYAFPFQSSLAPSLLLSLSWFHLFFLLSIFFWLTVSFVNSGRCRMRSLIIYLTVPWSTHAFTLLLCTWSPPQALVLPRKLRWQMKGTAAFITVLFLSEPNSQHSHTDQQQTADHESRGSAAYWLHTSKKDTMNIWQLQSWATSGVFFSSSVHLFDDHCCDGNHQISISKKAVQTQLQGPEEVLFLSWTLKCRAHQRLRSPSHSALWWLEGKMHHAYESDSRQRRFKRNQENASRDA